MKEEVVIERDRERSREITEKMGECDVERNEGPQREGRKKMEQGGQK